MLLNDRAIEALLAVASLGTTQAAAKKLRVTQTAVTQRIRVLETQLQKTLFFRSRRGMKLTADGERLVTACRELQDVESSLLAASAEGGRDHTVRLTLVGTMSILRTRLIPAFATVAREFPELVSTFIIDNSPSLGKALSSGVADLAVIPPHETLKEMDWKVLNEEEYILVGPRSWKRRALATIVEQERIIDFHEDDPLTLDLLRKLGLYKLVKQPRMYVNDTHLIAELVTQGLGYTVLTRGFAEPHLSAGKLTELAPRTSLKKKWCLAWNRRTYLPDYFRALVDAIE